MGGRVPLRALALWALAVLPVLWIVVHVARHTVQVPVHDQWQVHVRTAIQAGAGTLRPADLLVPHVQHRYLITRTLTAANTWLFGWDLRVDAFVNVLLALLTLACLVDLVRGQRLGDLAVVAVLFSVLVFSIRQRWTWGLLSSFLSVVLLLTVALRTLARRAPSWAALLVAAALATLATWSAGPGVALWPALGVAGWLAGYRRPAHAAVWGSLFATVMAVFAVGFEHRLRLVAGPLDLAGYTLAFLGGPLVPESARAMRPAMALGALGLAVAAAAVWISRRERADLRPAAPWLGLCVFSVAAAAVAAVARAPLLEAVPLQPLRARYVTLALPFWIGLTALVWLAVASAARPERRPRLARAAWLLLIALAPCYALASLTAARAPISPTPKHEDCLRRFPASRDASCLAEVTFGVRAIQPRIDELARLRLAAFRDPSRIP
jgi:hypothetical protein